MALSALSPAELDRALESAPPGRLAQTLSRLTALFLEQAPRLGEPHIAVFDEAILRLSRDIEFSARVELAERLARVEKAPPQVVKDLAFDDRIEVSGPVLEHSPCLSHAALLQIASTKGPPQMLAISRRSSVHERVSDVLILRGDREVALSLAANPGAKLSERGCTKLARRAAADSALAEALVARAGFPAELARELAEVARQRAEQALAQEFGSAENVGEAVEAATFRAAQSAGQGSPADDFADALLYVSRLSKSERLDERNIAGWARAGRMDRAIAGLAYIARIPVQAVARAIMRRTMNPC